jgi:hypothetical protein
VEDLGSTNGTLLNGSAIPAPTVASPGDELALGGSVLRVLAACSSSSAGAPGPPAPQKERRPALRVVAGWAPGTVIPVEGPMVLGRAAAGASAFEGDEAIGAEHVRVSPVGEGMLTIEDLGEAGGTLVDGVPIPAPTVVRTGDRFQIGGSTLEIVQAAASPRARPADPALEAGGVRELPEGLFGRIAMRAPVSAAEVRTTAALALGWSLALVLLLRELALGPLDVEPDLRALGLETLIPATVFPIVFNSFGFFKIFRRPDDTSVRHYLAPTIGVPLLILVINLVRINHSGAAEVAATVLIAPVLPVAICATLLLKLRDRVARRRVAAVRG